MSSTGRLYGPWVVAAALTVTLASCVPTEPICTGEVCQDMAGATAGGNSGTTTSCQTPGSGASTGLGTNHDGQCGAWQPLSSNQPTGVIASVAFDPREPAYVYAAAGNAFYRSDDSGSTWRMVSRFDQPIHTIAFPKPLAGTLLAASDDGVIESSDYGAHWQVKSLQGLPINKLFVHPADARIVLAAMNKEGILRSVDGGENWYPANDGLQLGDYDAIVGDPDNSAHVWVSVEWTNGWGGLSTAVVESSDTAGTWHSIFSATDGSVRGLAPCAANPHHIIAGTGPDLLLTKDSGVTWNRVPIPQIWTGVFAVGGPDCATLYLPSSGTPFEAVFYRSLDGGQTFTGPHTKGMEMLHSPFVNQFAFDPKDPSHGFVATMGGLFETHDAAEQWRLVPGVGFANIRKLVPIAARHEILAATWGSGLWRWSATSNEWSAVSGGEGFTDYLATVNVSPFDANRIIVGGWDSALLSEDGGSNYTVLFNTDNLYDVAFSPTNPQEVLAATYWTGVMRSTDSGRTWAASATGIDAFPEGSPLATGRFIAAVAFASNGRAYAGSMTRGYFSSSDQGVTWSTGPSVLSGISVRCLLPTAGLTYACTDTLGVAKLETSPLEFLTAGLDTLGVFGLTSDVDGTIYLATDAGVFKLGSSQTWESLESDQLPSRDTATPIVYRDGTSAKLIVSTSLGLYAHELPR